MADETGSAAPAPARAPAPRRGGAGRTAVGLLVTFGLVFAVFAGVTALSRALQGGPIIPEKTEDNLTERMSDDAEAEYPGLEWSYRTAGRDGEITSQVRGAVDDAATTAGLASVMRRHDEWASEHGRSFRGLITVDAEGVELAMPHALGVDAAEDLHRRATSGTWGAVVVGGSEGTMFTARGCVPDDGNCFGEVAKSAAEMTALIGSAGSGWFAGPPTVGVRIPVDAAVADAAVADMDGSAEPELPGREVEAVIPEAMGADGAERVRAVVELSGEMAAAGAAAATGAEGDGGGGGGAVAVPELVVVGPDGPRSLRVIIRGSDRGSMTDEERIAVLRKMIELLRNSGGGTEDNAIKVSVETYWKTIRGDSFVVDGGECGTAGEGARPDGPGDDDDEAPSPVEHAVRDILGCP